MKTKKKKVKENLNPKPKVDEEKLKKSIADKEQILKENKPVRK